MNRRAALGALAAGAALALAACGGGSGPASTTAAAGPTPSSQASQPPPATPTEPTPAPSALPDTITLAFGGDVHFADYLAPLARTADSLAALRSTIGAADLSMVNLETAITTRGTPVPKEFHFRAPASALDAVAGAGIDVVTMANNHAVDYGATGLADTLAAKRAGPIPIVGVGADAAEAFAPATFSVGGVSVAVFGADQVFDVTLAQHSATSSRGGVASSSPVTALRTAVAAARTRYDLVVVYLHWGADYQSCPRAIDVSTAKALASAGADIIVGSHAHRVAGAGWLGTAYVDYGLGNFVWWRSHEPDSRTGVLTVTVDARAARARRLRSATVVTAATWTPMLVGSNGIPAVPANAADTTRLHDLWAQARGCAGLAGSPG